MIDTKELRRLAQAAIAKMNASDPEFASSTPPLAILELLDRLEAAESECLEQARLNGMGSEREAALMAKLEAAEKSDAESIAMYRKARDERDTLRAKIAEMERQKPVGKFTQHPSNGLWEQDGYGDNPEASPLYALPGAKAQNATSVPSEEDESVRKAWSRFSNELHRGPDAPYPGMSEAFEQHFSQSFTDRDWRAESGTWAAAWKAAKRHGAQPAPNAVAYLDLGVGGYMDIGTDLTDEELATLPKDRHMLGIIGTYGVDGYVPAHKEKKNDSTD